MKKTRLILLSILTISHFFYSQEIKTEQELYNWFDSNYGKENLLLNNGPQHKNYDLTYNNDHRYFDKNEFIKGNIIYQNQSFYNILLKYDIFKDELIIKSSNDDTKYLEVNLIKNRVVKFTYQDKTFINIIDKNLGFFEEAFNKDSLKLFIKHFKDALEIIREDKLLIKYTLKNNFILEYQSDFHEMNKKNDWYKLFPEIKTEIENFYKNYNDIEKDNKIKFYIMLTSFIYDLKQKNAN